MTRPAHRNQAGFTLIELLITITIMGIIIVPLANFLLAYFETYPQTQTRMADSHDIQIASAYFSQDVANTGLRDSSTKLPKQSVWTATSGFPATYCGKGLGTTIVLLQWDDWSATSGPSGTGSDSIDSVAYIAETAATTPPSTTLHRVFCPGSTAAQSDATLVHNLHYPDSGNPTPLTCPTTATACATSTPPTALNLLLSIQGTADATPWRVTLSGQRRQATS